MWFGWDEQARMTWSDDLIACAGIVERGDPDRFVAAMAAPVTARAVLFPVYAFNVEVARAPFASAEPLIAEMRLQWWADALDEIAAGGSVRRHEVATPLSGVLDGDGARILGACIEARRRDARREDIESVAALRGYLSDTGGALMWGAARALGSDQEARAREVGTLSGLANYLLAVPEFLARGMRPLPEMTEQGYARFLEEMLRPGAPAASRPQRIAELSAWRARGVVRRALRDPAAVPEGRLVEAEFARRIGLFWRGLRV